MPVAIARGCLAPRVSRLRRACVALGWLLVSACGGGETTAPAPGMAGGARASAATDSGALQATAQDPRALWARAAAMNAKTLAEAQRSSPGSAAGPAGKAAGDAAALSPVYRFYNQSTGVHFYTISAAERDQVIGAMPQFRYEGQAFSASVGAAPGLSPVHRFFNQHNGVHFYSISETEKTFIQTNLPVYRYEGVAYHASLVEAPGFSPLQRFYVPAQGVHFYTASAQEAASVRASLPGFRYEGVGYYVGAALSFPAPFQGALPCAAGAITCVEVVADAAQASVPVTFGQSFRSADLQTTQALRAMDNTGAEVPVQTDEVSTHRDGSVRFAVISAQLAGLTAGERRIVSLFGNGSPRAAQTLPGDPDWNLRLVATVYEASGQVRTLVAEPQAALRAQISSGAGRRLHGAVASEYTVVVSFRDAATQAVHPHLTARLHARLYEGGQRIRTDVVLENTRTFVPGPGDIAYELAIQRNGQTIYTQPRFTHFHHARWHKVVWTGNAQPSVEVRHDMPYLLASKAVLNYDLSLKVPETTLAEEADSLARARAAQTSLGPMGNALLTTYFPTTGGRPDIGPLPRWTVLYLLSQDRRARDSMMANADASSAVSIHYRDEQTDRPVNLISYPRFTTYFNEDATPRLPAVSGSSTPWSPDTAHQASFGYVPYLLTGDAFYQDSMMFWANFNVFSLPTAWREFENTNLTNQQVRGQAWGMRSLAEVAWTLPDNHAQKAYFQTMLQNNLAWYGAHHQTLWAASPLGAIGHSRGNAETGPWQNDFVGLIFSLLAENNEPHAKVSLDWISRFNVGRFLADANGFCAARASGYYWFIKNAAETAYYSTWADLYQRNYPADAGQPCSSLVVDGGYPHLGTGAAAYARGMLGAAANAGVANARTAYDKWKLMTPLMDAQLPDEPIFAIVPRN